MNILCVSDKQGNMIYKVITYDKRVFKLLLKQLSKNKQLNVYEERR